MTTDVKHTKPDSPIARFVFAHGAGVGLDHVFMEQITNLLVNADIEVVRFNFPYMIKRMQDGKRRPPDRMPALVEAYQKIVDELDYALPTFIGGKSMGGRVATIVAADAQLPIKGVIALGYPFHPQKKPDKLRLSPIAQISHPLLIVQGERDALGNKQEVLSYTCTKQCQLLFLEDGDHDFKPRVKSGYKHQQHLATCAQKMVKFIHDHK